MIPGEEASLCNIAEWILGKANATVKLTHHIKKTFEMVASQASFSPKERKTWDVIYREEAACCVSDFCHSEESLCLDTESHWCIKVKYPITNSSESHPLWVWNKVTLEDHLPKLGIYKQWLSAWQPGQNNWSYEFSRKLCWSYWLTMPIMHGCNLEHFEVYTIHKE